MQIRVAVRHTHRRLTLGQGTQITRKTVIRQSVTITLSMFEERWVAMLVTRLPSVWLAAGLPSLAPRQQPVPMASQVLLVAGGLRGAVTLALALPVNMEGWWTVQSIAYGVVVFSLFVQAPLLEPLVRALQQRGHLAG